MIFIVYFPDDWTYMDCFNFCQDRFYDWSLHHKIIFGSHSFAKIYELEYKINNN